MKDIQDSVWDSYSQPVRMGRGRGGRVTRVMGGVLVKSKV